MANMYAFFRRWTLFQDNRPVSGAIAKGPTLRQWAQAHREELREKILAP